MDFFIPEAKHASSQASQGPPPRAQPAVPPLFQLLSQSTAGLQTSFCNFLDHSPLSRPTTPPSPAPAPAPAPAPSLPLQLLHDAITTLQTSFSNFVHHSPIPLLTASPPRTPSWAKISDALSNGPSTSSSSSSSSSGFDGFGNDGNSKSKNVPMSAEAIEERLAGIPVYALSNCSEEFVLVSGLKTGKNLGLFCFSEDDAKALLEQMKSMDPCMRKGSEVVAVALNKVFQLKVDGVAFRFIPEISQVQNAIKVRGKSGTEDEGFPGVPVFQSRSLTLRSQSKRYRPVFFRKEDLEKSLLRASRQQKLLNPAMREGDIQVAVLEDIIRGMKDCSSSTWDDIVFIPPGFDVATDSSRQ